jgi:hypothetical protein
MVGNQFWSKRRGLSVSVMGRARWFFRYLVRSVRSVENVKSVGNVSKRVEESTGHEICLRIFHITPLRGSSVRWAKP